MQDLILMSGKRGHKRTVRKEQCGAGSKTDALRFATCVCGSAWPRPRKPVEKAAASAQHT
eukprot:353887-Chlamydomonas_euryale.AAC.2